MSDLRINLGILAGSIALYGYALTHVEPGDATMDSMLWPKSVLILLMVFSACMSVYNLIQWRQEQRDNQPNKNNRSKISKGTVMGLVPISIAFLYVLSLQYMGYFIATIIFIPILMYTMGEKSKIKLVSLPLIFVFTVWVLFVQLALLMFPMGTGWFREINQIIMFGFGN